MGEAQGKELQPLVGTLDFILTHIYKKVCMYVCMYVCVYACKCVCMSTYFAFSLLCLFVGVLLDFEMKGTGACCRRGSRQRASTNPGYSYFLSARFAFSFEGVRFLV